MDALNWSELVYDIYPILKVLLQMKSEKAKKDQSFQNILFNKLRNASKSLTQSVKESISQENPYNDGFLN